MEIDFLETLAMTVFYSWPEESVILCFGLIFLHHPVKFKKVVPYGIILGTVTMATRNFLPFGMHAVILIFGMVMVFGLAYKTPWIKSLLAALTAVVIALLPITAYSFIISSIGIHSFDDMSLMMNLITAWGELSGLILTCLLFYWVRNYYAKKH